MEIKLRRDASDVWRRINPVLDSGEPGFEMDTGRLKIGDGTRPWTELPYTYGLTVDIPIPLPIDTSSLTAHIESPTPHPIYDDGPSLALIYQNAKV